MADNERVDELTDRVTELAVEQSDESEEEDFVPGDDDDEDDNLEDIMATLPDIMRVRVEELRRIHHEEKVQVMEEYVKERAMLEQKYAALLKPMYDIRKDIVIGAKDVSAKDKPEDDVEGDVEAEDEDANIVGIPQFWVVAMGHMEVIGELVTEQDVDCLEYLQDIRCEDHEDGKGFTLKFEFAENDYFTNTVLEKKYDIPNLLLDDEPVLQQVTGTTIEWKSDENNLCFKKVQKKQRSKRGPNAGQIRTITKSERTDSFFHFFEPPKLPNMEDMDEEEADALEEAFDHDYDVAQAFRSHIIPNAITWFTGEALDEDFEVQEGDLEAIAGAQDPDGTNNSPFPAPVNGNENPECKQN